MSLLRVVGLLVALLVVAAIPATTATAQSTTRPCFYNASGQCVYISSTNPLPVSAAVSASISGFAPATTGTPISVTTGGNTGTLPAGDVVTAFNTGATNTAYCKLGASATTSDIAIPPASWFAFTVGAATQLTCITSTSTTTVNMVGGAGLPTGAGGGGGGSGGGAVTIASGAVSSGAYSSGSIAAGALAAGALASGAGVDGWDLTQGAKADSVCGTATGTCSVVSLLKYLNSSIAGALPAGTNTIGGVTLRYTSTSVDGVALTASAVSTLESNKVIKSSPGNLSKFAVTTGSTAGYVALVNATAAPTAGGAALTFKACYTAPANSTVGDTFPIPAYFDTGIVIVFTTGSQCQTNTASATAVFQAQFQ